MIDKAFLSSDLFLLTLTVGLYCLGTAVYRRIRMPLLHPVLLTFVAVIVFLRAADIGYARYQEATGILDFLRDDPRFELLDGFDPAMPRPERIEIRRRGLLADLFITGVNAVTEQGTLHWLDKVGNRIAPVAFGPRKVVIVAGRNKIVADRAQAEDRIRTIAAPQNVARHPGFRTPCARTGVCSDCNSPDRVCNTRMEMLRCWPAGRVLVVLIDQELGL